MNDAVGANTVNRDAISLVSRLRSKEQRVLFPTTNSGYGIGQQEAAVPGMLPLKVGVNAPGSRVVFAQGD